MALKYKKSWGFGDTEIIIRTEDSAGNVDFASIPEDESNRDYQEYLAWVAEGNTPDPVE